MVDPRPLSSGVPHSSSLSSSTPVHSSCPKTWAGARTVSPEKARGSQETAPLPDCSQQISAAQSQSSCSVHPLSHPSPEARSGEGRPWLVHFLSHCLPDNGQSSTESDQGLTTPKTQIRAKGRGADCVEGSCQQGKITRDTSADWGVGEEGKDIQGPAAPPPKPPPRGTGPGTQTEQELELQCTRPCPAPQHSHGCTRATHVLSLTDIDT